MGNKKLNTELGSWSRRNYIGDLGDQISGDTEGKSVAFVMGIYSSCCNDLGFVLHGQGLMFAINARVGFAMGMCSDHWALPW